MEKIIFLVVLAVISLGIELMRKRGADNEEDSSGAGGDSRPEDNYQPFSTDEFSERIRRTRDAIDRAEAQRAPKNRRRAAPAHEDEFYESEAEAPAQYHEAHAYAEPAFDFEAALIKEQAALEESEKLLSKAYAPSSATPSEDEDFEVAAHRAYNADLGAMLKHRDALKTGFVVSEILGKPAALRGAPRF